MAETPSIPMNDLKQCPMCGGGLTFGRENYAWDWECLAGCVIHYPAKKDNFRLPDWPKEGEFVRLGNLETNRIMTIDEFQRWLKLRSFE